VKTKHKVLAVVIVKLAINEVWCWDMTYQARSGMIVVVQQTKKPLTRYVWSAEDLEAPWI